MIFVIDYSHTLSVRTPSGNKASDLTQTVRVSVKAVLIILHAVLIHLWEKEKKSNVLSLKNMNIRDQAQC